MAAVEHARQAAQVAQARLLADEHDVQLAVLERRVGREEHAAAEHAGVGDGDAVAREVERLAVDRDLPGGRAASGRSRAARRRCRRTCRASAASRARSGTRRSRCPRTGCRGRPCRWPRRGRRCAPRPSPAASTASTGSNGMSSLRAKSLPRPPGRTASRPWRSRSSPATAPMIPSPPIAATISPCVARLARELAGVLHRHRLLHPERAALAAQRGLHAGEQAQRAAAAGVRVDDQADGAVDHGPGG